MEIKSNGIDTFDAVYSLNAEKVYRTALYYSGDHHAAEDITQIVFMKWFICMDHVNEERIEVWVKSTAKNLALNYRRHAKYEMDLEVEAIECLIDTNEYESGVEMIFEYYYHKKLRIELVKEIYEALYRKNPRWHEAIMMAYILEKPQKDVAEHMGMSIGSLRILLYRAKNWIRKQYQEQLNHLDEA